MKANMMDIHDELISEPVYTIGHAAEKLGVAVPTLRMYEQAGLILPHRTQTNRRLYSRNDLERLQVMIDLIHNQHLNIEAIKFIYSLVPCWQIMACALEKRNQCRAYIDSVIPCWLLADPQCVAEDKDCRKCRVYLDCPKTLQNAKNSFKQFMK